MGNTIEEERTYLLPELAMDWLNTKVAKLNKKASKLNCEPVKIEIIETLTREVCVNGKEKVELIPGEAEAHGLTPLYNKTYNRIKINAPVIKYDGWEFIAAIDHGKEGNVIREIPSKVIPEEYRHSYPYCDHCYTKRNRKQTFIVYKEGEGYKQVGRQCLADFVGHTNPKYLASIAEWMFSCSSIGNDLKEESWYGNSKAQVTDLYDYLSWVALSVRISGWCSRSYAQETGKVSTCDRTWVLKGKYLKQEYGSEQKYPIDKDMEIASNAIIWATNLEPNNNYLHNIHTIAKTGYFSYKQDGLAASIVGSYLRNKAKQKEREARTENNKNSEWIGKEKERLYIELTVVSSRCIEGYYGIVTLFKFTDKDKNYISWFASGDKTGFEIGKSYKVKATIKRHQTYDGIKETVVSRVSKVAEG